MARPKIEIQLNRADHILARSAWLVLIILVALPLIFYSQLPEEIPVHYGADGKPDRWGARSQIFLMPTIGLVLFLILRWLAKHPQWLNYTVEITSENAHRHYRNSIRLLHSMNLLILLFFLYIHVTTLLLSFGHEGGLGSVFLWLFMVLMLVVPGYFWWNSARK